MSADQNNRPKGRIKWYRSLGFRLPAAIALCCMIPTILFSLYTQRQTRRQVLENARATMYTGLYGSSLLLEELLGQAASYGQETAADPELTRAIRAYREEKTRGAAIGKEETRGAAVGEEETRGAAVGEEKTRGAAARSRITLQLGQKLSSIRSLDAMYLVWEEGGPVLSTNPSQKEMEEDRGFGKTLTELYRKEAVGRISWLYVPEENGCGGLCYFRPLTGIGDENGSLVCQVRKENWVNAFQLPFETESISVCDYFGQELLAMGDAAEEGKNLTERFPEAFAGKNNYGTFTRKAEDGSWLVMYYNSVDNGWKYIARAATGELLEESGRHLQMPVIMILVGMFAAAAAYLLQSRLVLKPLRDLGSHLQRMESGDLTPMEDIRQQDEMGAIQENYNHMITELKRNIDEVYVQQLLRKQAQLSSLQAQIDEHFLYNTLNMIYCEANGEHAEKTAHMLWILSRYFRLNLSEGRDKVPLSEVVELMKLYLAIQKARFGEGLAVEMETFPDMDRYVALKYLFQPVVENAIVHGFEKKLGNHHLKIILRKEENRLFFCVEDDGSGMSAGKLSALQEEIRTFEAVEGSGFALKNLREQLRITYGEEYGIEIESAEGAGTRVYFRIPLECREEQKGEGDE